MPVRHELVLHVPDRIEYPLEVTQSPELLRPGDTATLTFRILNPATRRQVSHFELVHEKLMHLFIVSENLEFFAHVHPVLQPDGSFVLKQRLPDGGMLPGCLQISIRPVPCHSLQWILSSFPGTCKPSALTPSLGPSKSVNLTASLRLDPPTPLAGLGTKMFFTLKPGEGLQPYLGAWGHMLVASADLIDMIHLHPFIANGSPDVQFNITFPARGCTASGRSSSGRKQ